MFFKKIGNQLKKKANRDICEDVETFSKDSNKEQCFH